MNIPYKRIGQLNGDMLAEEIGCTRQRIYQILESGLGKLYYGMKRKCPDLTPFEIVEGLRGFFGCDCKEEVEMFYNMFPTKVKNEIKNSLLKEFKK